MGSSAVGAAKRFCTASASHTSVARPRTGGNALSEDGVVCARDNSQAVVATVDDRVLDQDVLSLEVDAVGVLRGKKKEGESDQGWTKRARCGTHERVASRVGDTVDEGAAECGGGEKASVGLRTVKTGEVALLVEVVVGP